jgi:tyrosyl-tRNA synthetase
LSATGSVIEGLVNSGLASSNTDARRLVNGNAVSINGQKVQRENFEESDFHNGRLLLRKGKAYKDSVLVELG